MKKSTPWAEQHAEAERQIREDERKSVLAEFSKSQRECYEFASKIMQRTAAFRPPSSMTVASGAYVDGTVQPQAPAPKRKATTANQEQMDEALRILRNVKPPDEPLTPKQVVGTWNKGYGGKISAAAALRALVGLGMAVEVKRGKFKAVGIAKEDVGNGSSVAETNASGRR